MNIHILVFSLWYICCWCLWQQNISRIYVLFLWVIIRQIFLGRDIISLFDYNRPTWIQAVIAEQVHLQKNLNFNMKWRGDIHVYVATKNITLTILTSETLPGNVNMGVSSNIWNRNTFRTTSLYALGVYKQFQRRKLSNWICSTN